jgi:hypothetical protein
LVDGPLLTIAGHRLTALRDGEARIDAERTIDVVENAIRFVGQDPSLQPAAFDAALRQGAADATLEHAFLQESFPQLTLESGVELLQRSQREKRPTVLAGPRDADALRRAGMSDADVEWIRANEPAASRLLVATAAPAHAAWWSVRPDGTSVLRVSGGRGQAAAEHGTDVMLVSLKVMFGLICGFEVVHSSHGEPTAAKGWKIAFCTVATGLSLGFVMGGWHAASWVLIGIETVEFASTGLQH